MDRLIGCYRSGTFMFTMIMEWRALSGVCQRETSLLGTATFPLRQLE
jgi:hypothetical protein